MARLADPHLKSKILQAAREVFKERGFAAARMGDIAERAGVAVGSIYLHFKTKEELCAALSDEVNRRVLNESLPLMRQPDPAQAISDGIRAALRICDEERDVLSLLYLTIGLVPLEANQPTETDIALWQTFTQILQERMDAGEFRRYEAGQLAQLISNLIERTAAGCLLLGTGDVQDYADTIVTFLRNALLVNLPAPARESELAPKKRVRPAKRKGKGRTT